MKTLFKKMLAGAFLATLFLNVTVNAQTWNIPTAGSTTSTYFGVTGGSDNLIFKTNSAERLRITSTGLVGIGDFSSSSLYSPLQVGTNVNKFSVGKIGGSQRAYIGFNACHDGTNWNVYTEDDDDDHGGAIITTEENGSLNFYCKTVGGQNNNQTVSNTNFFTNSLGLRVSPYDGDVSTPLSLFVGGSAVIGTVTSYPSGYKLYVDDGILTEKIKVGILGTASWADFVFDKSYKLMPLAEVKKYIDKNKHLPDVPSAEEMVDNGLDVATMDAKLLQKIEELTLYMIEMKEQNEKLVKKTEELEKKIELLKEKK